GGRAARPAALPQRRAGAAAAPRARRAAAADDGAARHRTRARPRARRALGAARHRPRPARPRRPGRGAGGGEPAAPAPARARLRARAALRGGAGVAAPAAGRGRLRPAGPAAALGRAPHRPGLVAAGPGPEGRVGGARGQRLDWTADAPLRYRRPPPVPRRQQAHGHLRPGLGGAPGGVLRELAAGGARRRRGARARRHLVGDAPRGRPARPGGHRRPAWREGAAPRQPRLLVAVDHAPAPGAAATHARPAERRAGRAWHRGGGDARLDHPGQPRLHAAGRQDIQARGGAAAAIAGRGRAPRRELPRGDAALPAHQLAPGAERLHRADRGRRARRAGVRPRARRAGGAAARARRRGRALRGGRRAALHPQAGPRLRLRRPRMTVASAQGRVLVVNAGSSSLKMKLLPGGESLQVERLGGPTTARASFALVEAPRLTRHDEAFDFALEVFRRELGELDLAVVGHRVVHGGTEFTAPTLITAEVEARIEALSPLAPLHNPGNLAALRAARRALPEVPHVAVFDTAFHATLPERAYLYGLPLEYAERGMRRYGFHGTSHEYVSGRAAE